MPEAVGQLESTQEIERENEAKAIVPESSVEESLASLTTELAEVDSELSSTGVSTQGDRRLVEAQGGLSSLASALRANNIEESSLSDQTEPVGTPASFKRNLKVVHTGGRPPIAPSSSMHTNYEQMERDAEQHVLAEQNREALSNAVANLQDKYKFKFEEELLQYQMGGDLRERVFGAPSADWEIEDGESGVVYKVVLRGRKEKPPVMVPDKKMPADLAKPYPHLVAEQLRLGIQSVDGDKSLAGLEVECRDSRPVRIKMQIPFNEPRESDVIRNNFNFHSGISYKPFHIRSLEIPHRMSRLIAGIDPESRLGRLMTTNVSRESDFALIERVLSDVPSSIEHGPRGDDTSLNVNFTTIEVDLDSVGNGDPLKMRFSGGAKILPPYEDHGPSLNKLGLFGLKKDPIRVQLPPSISSYDRTNGVVNFEHDGRAAVKSSLEKSPSESMLQVDQFPSLTTEDALGLVDDLLALTPFPSDFLES